VATPWAKSTRINPTRCPRDLTNRDPGTRPENTELRVAQARARRAGPPPAGSPQRRGHEHYNENRKIVWLKGRGNSLIEFPGAQNRKRQKLMRVPRGTRVRQREAQTKTRNATTTTSTRAKQLILRPGAPPEPRAELLPEVHPKRGTGESYADPARRRRQWYWRRSRVLYKIRAKASRPGVQRARRCTDTRLISAYIKYRSRRKRGPPTLPRAGGGSTHDSGTSLRRRGPRIGLRLALCSPTGLQPGFDKLTRKSGRK
jgi:hypothetical protein